MEFIKIVYALGNPGWENTYHNLGFDLLESLDQTNWFESKFFAFKKYGNLILAKNLVLMNASGLGVKEALVKFKIKPEELCLIHDDNDLLFGLIKFQFEKSSAGHKGVESVINELKTNKFWRLRIGIGHSRRKKAEKFVLKKLNSHHQKIFKKMCSNFPKLIDILATTPVYKINLSRNFLLKD